MDKTRFAILGAGNGGQSLAAYVAERGFHVAALYDRFPQAIEHVKKRGGVEMVGPVRSGFGKVDLITTDIREAIGAGDVLFVVVPSVAHEWIAEHAAPHLRDGQMVVVMPGYPGGTLLFRKTFREKGVRSEVTLAETTSLPFATRIVGPAQVGIKGITRTLFIAALPSEKTKGVVEVLKSALPMLKPVENVLVTGLNEINYVHHVAAYLLNLGRIDGETQTDHFDWHKEWVTPQIKKVQMAIDQERKQVAEALEVPYYSAEELHEMWHGDEPWHIVQRTGEIPESAQTVPPRYITEDVPSGLVPIASLGRMLGVATPVADSLIKLVSVIKGVDYWKEGRTLEKLGLAGLTVEEIRALVI